MLLQIASDTVRVIVAPDRLTTIVTQVSTVLIALIPVFLAIIAIWNKVELVRKDVNSGATANRELLKLSAEMNTKLSRELGAQSPVTMLAGENSLLQERIIRETANPSK